MGIQQGAKSWDVPVVVVVELKGWAVRPLVLMMALGEELDAVEDGLEGIAQVIDNDDIISCLEELERSMGANEAKSPCDEDVLAGEGEVVEAVAE